MPRRVRPKVRSSQSRTKMGSNSSTQASNLAAKRGVPPKRALKRRGLQRPISTQTKTRKRSSRMRRPFSTYSRTSRKQMTKDSMMRRTTSKMKKMIRLSKSSWRCLLRKIRKVKTASYTWM